ncbi:hypothetical protein J6590_063249 [Homalodisca vitripennis]|nr:hypothetical protein J6590_063249 [Homalodisca vitripennis]
MALGACTCMSAGHARRRPVMHGLLAHLHSARCSDGILINLIPTTRDWIVYRVILAVQSRRDNYFGPIIAVRGFPKVWRNREKNGRDSDWPSVMRGSALSTAHIQSAALLPQLALILSRGVTTISGYIKEIQSTSISEEMACTKSD